MQPQPAHNVVPAGRRVSRRQFLELMGVGGAATAITGSAWVLGSGPLGGAAGAAPLPPGYVPSFPDGIASGDPHPDGSVIWTRLGAPTPAATLTAVWEVATDDTFSAIVAGGTVDTTDALDYTVKVGVTGLLADRWYSYRFSIGGATSVTGRLRTAPAPGTSPDELVFAWASCQQINDSLYVAHRAISEEPGIDFWMHLGDYVYVSDGGTITLDDYRSVYHRFKANALLQDLQAKVPLVAIWDDGEFYNGVDGAGPPARLAAGRRAWFETMPVIPPLADPDRAYRDFAWGDLADVFMMDTRMYRDPAVEATDTRTPEGAVIFDPSRTVLGAAQKAALKGGLAASPARWKLLGNSYNFGMWRVADLDNVRPLPPGVHQNEGLYAPNEAWDDYWAERKELLEFIRDQPVQDVVSVSGHTHIWIAGALQPDPDDPNPETVAFDLTCGSLTADPDVIRQGVANGGTPESVFAQYEAVADASKQINPWQTHVDFVTQGYGLARITPDQAVFEFKGINTYDPDAEPIVLARFTIRRGSNTMTSEVFEAPCFDCAPIAPTSTTTTTATAPPSTPSSGGASTAPSSAAPVNPRAATVAASPRFTG